MNSPKEMGQSNRKSDGIILEYKIFITDKRPMPQAATEDPKNIYPQTFLNLANSTIERPATMKIFKLKRKKFMLASIPLRSRLCTDRVLIPAQKNPLKSLPGKLFAVNNLATWDPANKKPDALTKPNASSPTG